MPTGWLIRRTAARGTTWKKPALFWERPRRAAAFLFWFCVAVFVYSLFFQWPDGVAGDRRAQLPPRPLERSIPRQRQPPAQTWSGGQVFTVDVTRTGTIRQYDEPAETTKARRLQPGRLPTTSASSNARGQCSGVSRRPRRRPDADQHRRNKALLETIPRVPGPGSDDPSDQYATDPTNSTSPDPYDYYEPGRCSCERAGSHTPRLPTNPLDCVLRRWLSDVTMTVTWE